MNGKSHARDTLIAADENRAMFNSIARRYDLMNRIISLGFDGRWRRLAIDTLGVVSDGRYLDVGAGTGDLMLEIAGRAPRVSGFGLDPSVEMLSMGVRKASKAGLGPHLSFQVGDAVTLPYADNRFNGIVLGFCIRNVTDRKRALREFLRVLKPGARLVILELTTPPGGFPAVCHQIFTSTVVPTAAFLLSLKSAYTYLVKSVRAFPSPATFQEMMRNAGFDNTARMPLTFGTVTIFSGAKPF